MLLKFLCLLFCIIYFMCIACLWFIDRYIENELPENFQDVYFEDIEQLQAEFEGKCPWHILYLFFLYLSIGLHAGSY
jgi:hypothetical protein